MRIMTESLWGDIPKGDNLKTPISILREQAAILGDATDNILVADVVPNTQRGTVTLHFYVTAPALDNYRVHLLQVRHDVALYPLVIATEWMEYDCQTEEIFKEDLRTVLSSQE